jgi:2-hydroxychromene-2-carboxylate isomerase
MRIENMAAQAEVSVRWRPFNIASVLTEHPFLNKPAKTRYMWRDIERRTKRFGLEWNGIPPYPVDKSTLPTRIAVLGEQQGWVSEYSKAVYRAWFLEHQDIGDETVLTQILTSIGKEATAVIAQAHSAAIKQTFFHNSDLARDMGVVGSPSFVVGKEVFWGDDRLEEALEWAQSHSANQSLTDMTVNSQ